MKDLTKQKNIYYVSRYKKFPIITKEIFIYLLILFILVFYYYICIYTCTYNFSIYNDELTTICTISFEELKPVNHNQSNIWYKYFLDDFFNTFTSSSKTINPKIIEVKSDVKTLMPLKHNISTVYKSVILNKIQSDFIRSLILECKSYKDKTLLLELQLLNTKIAYHNLIRDIDDITKEMHHSLKKS